MNLHNKFKMTNKTVVCKKDKGFTLIELLVVLALIVIISSVSVEVFYNLKEKYSIQKDADSIVSIIEKTKTMSLNRKNDSSYGVSFSSSTVTVFSGATQSTGNNISKYDLENTVKVSAVTLSSHSTEIGFIKTSGAPNATGTIVLSTPSYSKTITISETGIIEIK